MRSFRPLRAMEVLREHGVRFVVIGGVAGSAHGSPSITGDLDICYQRTRPNLNRLAAALRTLNARLRGVEEEVPFQMEAETIERGDHFTFATDAGDLDCIGTPAGTQGFEDLDANARDADLDGLVVRIASLDDLIRMKRAAGRAKDRAELEILGALRDELSG